MPQVSLRIPLYTDRTLAETLTPFLLVLVPATGDMTEAGSSQGPFEALAGYLDRQNTFLLRFGGPASAVGHPEE